MIPKDLFKDKSDILITCPKGLSEYIYRDLLELKFPVRGRSLNFVKSYGSIYDCMTLNLCLSTAHHILYSLNSFTCNSPNDLYREIYSMEWEKLIPIDTNICITSIVKNRTIKDSRYANLKCKDAICDRLVLKCNARCGSSSKKDKTVIHLYWRNENCTVYLDTSGEPLFRRGYRKNAGLAPLQETLANAIVRTSVWNENLHFINPMCGSGTLAIEAALIAKNRKPQIYRENFGFMHILQFKKEVFEELKEKLLCLERPFPSIKLIATDISDACIKIAKENAKNAGVLDYIEFKVCPFEDTPIPNGNGVVIINPEYGIRLGEIDKLKETYKLIGNFFKQKCIGYKCYVFSGNYELVKRISLKAKNP